MSLPNLRVKYEVVSQSTGHRILRLVAELEHFICALESIFPANIALNSWREYELRAVLN